MQSCQYSYKLLSITIALCVSMTFAFPRGLDSWTEDMAGRPRSVPLINVLFNSLLRSQIQHHERFRASPVPKRIGIAGLDNMDAITTTLDRFRNRKGPRRMSMRMTVADLRRLLEAGR